MQKLSWRIDGLRRWWLQRSVHVLRALRLQPSSVIRHPSSEFLTHFHMAQPEAIWRPRAVHAPRLALRESRGRSGGVREAADLDHGEHIDGLEQFERRYRSFSLKATRGLCWKRLALVKDPRRRNLESYFRAELQSNVVVH